MLCTSWHGGSLVSNLFTTPLAFPRRKCILFRVNLLYGSPSDGACAELNVSQDGRSLKAPV
ncbi:hypothetical protein BaRGS_00024898, partial [Batillaria attramentaria]